VVGGKRVVLVDDSIVRGTTSRKIVRMLKHAGATEVHMRISSPPTKNPCHYGIDTPRRTELIAATHDLGQIEEFIGADSLGYLSLEGMLAAFGKSENETCAACFSGRYPVPFARPEAQPLLFPLEEPAVMEVSSQEAKSSSELDEGPSVSPEAPFESPAESPEVPARGTPEAELASARVIS
jgi:hypothetical protein